jgi:hypothetical protein
MRRYELQRDVTDRHIVKRYIERLMDPEGLKRLSRQLTVGTSHRR